MWSSDIRKICERDPDIKETFKDVLSKDQVEHFNQNPTNWLNNFYDSVDFPLSFVLNTGTIKDGGLHWQAVYFDVERNIYFFDSYGHKPMNQFLAFFENIVNYQKPKRFHYDRKKIHEICREIQAFDTKVCGEYCIYFLHVMNTVKHPGNGERIMYATFPPPVTTDGIHREKRDAMDNYTQFYINDEFVKDWLQRRYNYYKVKGIFVDQKN